MKSDFLGKLAESTPTPGGGSAAAYTAATAAALVIMVARLTIGKKNYLEVQDRMEAAVEKAENWLQILDGYVEIDALAYQKVIGAQNLPHRTPGESTARVDAIQKAAFHAANVPLQTALIAIKVMSEAVMLVSEANINAIADAACAVALCRAAITSAGYNVKINLLPYNDLDEAQKMITGIEQFLQQAENYHQQTQQLMKQRGGI